MYWRVEWSGVELVEWSRRAVVVIVVGTVQTTGVVGVRPSLLWVRLKVRWPGSTVAWLLHFPPGPCAPHAVPRVNLQPR